MKFNDREQQLLGLCIEEMEARTCAEVVLVIRKSSGNYKDVSYLVGAGMAWFALLLVLSIPTEVPEMWIPLPLVFVFWSLSWLAHRTPLRAWLSTRKRKSLQVNRAAHACFYEKKIHETSSHSGILLYCSSLEKQARIVMDRNAAAALETKRISEFEAQLTEACGSQDRFKALSETLRTLGLYLGAKLPSLPTPLAHELANLPELDQPDEEN